MTDFYPYCIREDEDCVITVHLSADHVEPIGTVLRTMDGTWFGRNEYGRRLGLWLHVDDAIGELIEDYEETQAQREFWCTP